MAAEPFSPAYQAEDLASAIVIYRAVNPHLVDWLALGADGNPAFGSQVFQAMSPERAATLGYPQPAMSVALSHLLDEHGESPDRVLDDFDASWGIAALTIADLRAIEPPLGVCSDPKEEAPWHGLVFGLTRLIKKPEIYGMRDVATWVKPPARV